MTNYTPEGHGNVYVQRPSLAGVQFVWVLICSVVSALVTGMVFSYQAGAKDTSVANKIENLQSDVTRQNQLMQVQIQAVVDNTKAQFDTVNKTMEARKGVRDDQAQTVQNQLNSLDGRLRPLEALISTIPQQIAAGDRRQTEGFAAIKESLARLEDRMDKQERDDYENGR